MDVLPYLHEFCRLFIFTVLLFSSLGKARTFGKFRNDLTESLRVSQRWARAFTVGLIAVEGLLALALVLNTAYTYGAMLGAMALFLGFTVWIFLSVRHDRLVRCNCFGQNEEYVSYLDILRNGILLLASGFYLWGASSTTQPFPIQLLLFGLACIACVLVTNLKNIALLARNPKHP